MILRRERQIGQTRSAQEFHKVDVIRGFSDWKVYAFCAGQFGADTMLVGLASRWLYRVLKY